jgi:hypothetical protein
MFEIQIRIQYKSQYSRAVEAGTIALQDSKRSSDNNSSLSDSDLSSERERYTSNKVGRSSTRKYSL